LKTWRPIFDARGLFLEDSHGPQEVNQICIPDTRASGTRWDPTYTPRVSELIKPPRYFTRERVGAGTWVQDIFLEEGSDIRDPRVIGNIFKHITGGSR
jgi:hypothetical protein